MRRGGQDWLRSPVILTGVARRLLDASVITCVGFVAALAFRNSLWWIVGSSATAAGLPELALLLGITGLTVFALVLALETALRSHPDQSGLPGPLSRAK